MNGTEFARINGGKYSTAFIGTYELTGQNSSGNSSNFKIRVYGYYGGGTSSGSSYGTVWISGTEYAIGSYRLYPGYTILAQKDITVYHNNDGSFPYTTQAFAINSYHASGEVSGAITAPSIPRQANVTGFWDFNDEQNPKINYSNPGGFRINARLEFSGSIIRRDNISNTGSYTFSLTDAERKMLRQKCTGNSMSVRGVIATCIGGTTENYWSYWDRTMIIVNGKPEFNNFEFEDINTKTLALTGNNQNIIKGYSNIKVTIPVVNKATSKKESAMNKYRFTCGDKNSSDAMTYSDTEAVTGTINGVPNGTFNVYAIDSRNNSTLVTKLANQVIDYTPLTKGNFKIDRNNGVSEQVILKFDGQINVINFGTKTNSIKPAKFRYRSTESDSEWSEPEQLTLDVSNGTFSFEGMVKGDTESLGFNVANSYEVEVVVEDELSKVKYTDKFGSGKPNLALAKQGVGIMGKYDEEVGGLLQVGGKRLEPNLVAEYTCTSNETYIKFDNIDILKDGGIYELYIAGTVNQDCMILLQMNNNSGNNHYIAERINAAGNGVSASTSSGARNKSFARGATQGFSAKCTLQYDEVTNHVNWLSQSYTYSSPLYLDLFGGHYNTAHTGDHPNNMKSLWIIAWDISNDTAKTFSAGTVCKLYKK